jgi:hypothetical protein
VIVAEKPKWACKFFSITLPSSQLPELLRRLAAEIERREPEMVFDVVVRDDGEEVDGSVYYWSDGDPPDIQ